MASFQYCFLLILGGGGAEKLTQKPCMFLILNCKSIVINFTAKETFLPFSLSGSIVPHGSTWFQFLGAVKTMDINTALGCSTVSWISTWPEVTTLAIDTNVTSDSSVDHVNLNGLLWQHEPQTSTWCLEATPMMDSHNFSVV